jgi:hydrogenase expression/formation protein HypD
MKYVDEFRDGATARGFAARIAAELLPPELRLIHGPGCPVCVLPIGRIDQAIALALELERGVILATYGDLRRPTATPCACRPPTA